MALSFEQIQAAIDRYRGGPVAPTNASNPMPPQEPVAPAPIPVEAPVVAAPPAAQLPVEVPISAPPVVGPTTVEEGVQNYAERSKAAADAIRADAELQAKAHEDEGLVLQAQAEEQDKQAQAFEAERKAYEEQADQTLAQANELNKQADAMKAVDSRSTTQKAMGVLAVALGSVADGFARMGGNNNTDHSSAVLKQIDNQVARDLEQQQAAINDKRKAAASKLTELGIARSMFGDTQEAAEYASTLVQRKYAAALKQASTKLTDEQARSAGEVAASNLEANAALQQATILERYNNQKLRSRAAGGGSGGGGGGALSASDVLSKLDSGEPMTKAERDFALKLDANRKRDAATQADDQRADKALETKGSGANGTPKLSDSQIKANALYEGSKDDRAVLDAAIKSGKIPTFAEASAASTDSVIPDALVDKQALATVKSAERIVVDVLRDESGAAIGANEKRELLVGLRSTDADTRRTTLQRIQAKVNAMGHKAPTKAVPNQEPKHTNPTTGKPQMSAPTMVKVIRADGTPGSIPFEKLELAKRRGWKVVE